MVLFIDFLKNGKEVTLKDILENIKKGGVYAAWPFILVEARGGKFTIIAYQEYNMSFSRYYQERIAELRPDLLVYDPDKFMFPNKKGGGVLIVISPSRFFSNLCKPVIRYCKSMYQSEVDDWRVVKQILQDAFPDMEVRCCNYDEARLYSENPIKASKFD
jgi:hypothetical protein